MAQPLAIRAIMPMREAWLGHSRPLLIAAGAMLAIAIGVAGIAARAAFAPPSVAAQMFEDIRYSALFSGRDPDATVRKAELRVHVLMQDFGMSRDRAAEYVARIMIEQSGGLCSGI